LLDQDSNVNCHRGTLAEKTLMASLGAVLAADALNSPGQCHHQFLLELMITVPFCFLALLMDAFSLSFLMVAILPLCLCG
jgi:hypothetical protein